MKTREKTLAKIKLVMLEIKDMQEKGKRPFVSVICQKAHTFKYPAYGRLELKGKDVTDEMVREFHQKEALPYSRACGQRARQRAKEAVKDAPKPVTAPAQGELFARLTTEEERRDKRSTWDLAARLFVEYMAISVRGCRDYDAKKTAAQAIRHAEIFVSEAKGLNE